MVPPSKALGDPPDQYSRYRFAIRLENAHGLLDKPVTDIPRGWIEGLRAALEASGWCAAEDECRAAAEEFAVRLPSSYFERTEPAVAAADLIECEALGRWPAGPGAAGPPLRMAVQPDPDPGAGMFRFRLYGRRAVELSSFLPVLESFGLSVVEAVPHHIRGEGGGPPLHLDDFGLRAQGRWRFDPAVDGARLVAAVEAVWRGDAERDSLNRLVVVAGLEWTDVGLLRAYRRYRRQAGAVWSDRQLDDPLVAFPAVTTALLGYFGARFDPAAGADDADSARRSAVESLGAVERLEQDQVLRGYLGLVDATLRTSHYSRTAGGDRLPTVTLKLSSAGVPELPAPRPLVETFVYSPRLEGLHLRGGLIARGGIRWSDRHQDLRTEVLGLVRAQVLKNAGIVPTGAKGGFVSRRLDPAVRRDGAEPVPVDVAAEVKECYRLFVSGLLDITDNVVAGRVVTPEGVRAADGEDSYLVVAADRGTAVLSDVANEISAGHRFWLGDAFASGGRHGYDHKSMGITARGAWVVVQQHFRQLGIDVQSEEIRVVGVGDMSGDVFGNGMLRSRTIKLLAAFDHRDIFIDPSPDPARSWEARSRLFAMARSSWQDYDRSALSAGGGVYSRTAKQVDLSPEARQALGVGASAVSPPELVSAILTASADLLWLGGVGTFVKAAGESSADAADPANNAVRVDADQVRARVVAEGGNLGFTQRARIAYSRRGGRINTDFIDNAAGVATSDYEVNLKILLELAIEQGRLDRPGRDRLLAEVQGDVAASVLRDVGLSASAVTRAVPASAADLEAFDALMTGLESAGHLDRGVEGLPSAEEIVLRRAAGAGLTRPEAAVLLAMAKSGLAHALQTAPVVSASEAEPAVESYFPPAVVERFGGLMAGHRLYHQLAATRVASEMVDRMGIVWAHETADELGADLAEVAAAYWAARQVLDADRRWRQVEDLASGLTADAEAALHATVADAVATLSRRYLGSGPVELERRVGEDRPLAAALGTLDTDAGDEARVSSLVDAGVERSLAAAFARLTPMAGTAEVGALVRSVPAGVSDVVAALRAFDEGLRLPGFAAHVADLPARSRWERWQGRRLVDDIAGLRRDAVFAALGRAGAGAGAVGDPSTAMRAWLAARQQRLARFLRLADQLDGSEPGAQSLAALAVRALRQLVESPGEAVGQDSDRREP